MPSPERIQAFFNPTSKMFADFKGKEHRDFARSVLREAFASSKWADLGMPDSQYAMEALDTMQYISERWAASGKAPTIEQAKEFGEIAKRAVDSISDELTQEARALAADFARESGGGRAARSERGGNSLNIPADRQVKMMQVENRNDLTREQKSTIIGQILRGERDNKP